MDIGRLCVKTTGRDAGKTCVIVDDLKNRMVLIDGETRRRKCNILHLVPLAQTISIKKGASHDKVSEALKKIGMQARATKPKKAAPRPRKQRKQHVKKKPAKTIAKAALKPAVKKTAPKALAKKKPANAVAKPTAKPIAKKEAAAETPAKKAPATTSAKPAAKKRATAETPATKPVVMKKK